MERVLASGEVEYKNKFILLTSLRCRTKKLRKIFTQLRSWSWVNSGVLKLSQSRKALKSVTISFCAELTSHF